MRKAEDPFERVLRFIPNEEEITFMRAIRPLKKREVNRVYLRVMRDFPPIERPPLYKLHRHIRCGVMHGHLYEEEDAQAGYAFVLRSGNTPRAMLYLYAVEPEMRGQGVGSEFLRELLANYAAQDGLYAEVEMVEHARSEKDKQTRLNRIAFYEKLGFRRVEGLYYSIYVVEMHLFYKPLSAPEHPDAAQAARDAEALYRDVLKPHEMIHLKAYPI